MINQALYQLQADVLILVSGYIGGTDSNQILGKYSYMKCARDNPRIQRRVFQNWMNRIPELARVPLVIIQVGSLLGHGLSCGCYDTSRRKSLAYQDTRKHGQ